MEAIYRDAHQPMKYMHPILSTGTGMELGGGVFSALRNSLSGRIPSFVKDAGISALKRGVSTAGSFASGASKFGHRLLNGVTGLYNSLPPVRNAQKSIYDPKPDSQFPSTARWERAAYRPTDGPPRLFDNAPKWDDGLD